MSVRTRTPLAVGAAAALALAIATGAAAGPVETKRDHGGIVDITPITQVFTYGQKVVAVAVEYSATVNPRTLDTGTFTVSDSTYNFRYDPIEDLATRADRTVTRVYTNDEPALEPSGESDRGRFVIVELDPGDVGGNTVIVSKCPTFLCSVKVNPDLPTQVVQNEDVYAQPGNGLGRGPLLASASPDSRSMTTEPIDLLVDEFTHDTFVHAGSALPYAYHLPADYDPTREYPMVVILPGHGMGYDGDNLGVQLAADIPATAWLQEEWTGTDEDVIVLAPQNPRVGVPAEAAAMVALVRDFMADHAVDAERVYASTVSYGSTTAWQALSTDPGLFTAVLLTGGFRVSAAQAAAIAPSGTPIWVTHGTNDHLLPVAWGLESVTLLRDAYVAAGFSPEEAADLIRWTEYGNEAYSEPDYHAAYGPTYEDQSILQWLLAQRG
jgi:predicted peptidase